MNIDAQSFVDVQCFGGPRDGEALRVSLCSAVIFPRLLLSTAQVEKSVYALEATLQGRFRLVFIHSYFEAL